MYICWQTGIKEASATDLNIEQELMGTSIPSKTSAIAHLSNTHIIRNKNYDKEPAIIRAVKYSELRRFNNCKTTTLMIYSRAKSRLSCYKLTNGPQRDWTIGGKQKGRKHQYMEQKQNTFSE